MSSKKLLAFGVVLYFYNPPSSCQLEYVNLYYRVNSIDMDRKHRGFKTSSPLVILLCISYVPLDGGAGSLS